jgi:transposase
MIYIKAMYRVRSKQMSDSLFSKLEASLRAQRDCFVAFKLADAMDSSKREDLYKGALGALNLSIIEYEIVVSRFQKAIENGLEIQDIDPEFHIDPELDTAPATLAMMRRDSVDEKLRYHEGQIESLHVLRKLLNAEIAKGAQSPVDLGEGNQGLKEEENQRLKAELRDMEIRNGAPKPDSGNSSLPGSMDIVKKNKPLKVNIRIRKKQGPKYGHEPAVRELLKEDDPKVVVIPYKPHSMTCPCCGGKLVRVASKDTRHDQYEQVGSPLTGYIHKAMAYRCKDCRTPYKGLIPEKIKKTGLCGVRLMAWICMEKVADHTSLRNIAGLFDDMACVHFSVGTINNYLKRAIWPLLPAYLELLDSIKTAKLVQADETHIDVIAKMLWAWVFVTRDAVVYKIGPRSRDVLDSVLGEPLERIIVSDCYSVYLSYIDEFTGQEHQLCLSHVARDFKSCAEHTAIMSIRKFGIVAGIHLKVMFFLHKRYMAVEDKGSKEALELKELERAAGNRLLEYVRNAPRIPKTKANALAKRFLARGKSYIKFLDDDSIPLTNNLSEQFIRLVVQDRKTSYGAQSELGARFLEIMWTVFSTLKLKGSKFFHFLIDTFNDYYDGKQTPSLLNLLERVPVKYMEKAEKLCEENAQQRKEAKKARAEREKNRGDEYDVLPTLLNKRKEGSPSSDGSDPVASPRPDGTGGGAKAPRRRRKTYKRADNGSRVPAPAPSGRKPEPDAGPAAPEPEGPVPAEGRKPEPDAGPAAPEPEGPGPAEGRKAEPDAAPAEPGPEEGRKPVPDPAPVVVEPEGTGPAEGSKPEPDAAPAEPEPEAAGQAEGRKPEPDAAPGEPEPEGPGQADGRGRRSGPRSSGKGPGNPRPAPGGRKPRPATRPTRRGPAAPRAVPGGRRSRGATKPPGKGPATPRPAPGGRKPRTAPEPTGRGPAPPGPAPGGRKPAASPEPAGRGPAPPGTAREASQAGGGNPAVARATGGARPAPEGSQARPSAVAARATASATETARPAPGAAGTRRPSRAGIQAGVAHATWADGQPLRRRRRDPGLH